MSPANMRILLAEDSRVNQALAVGILEKQGYTVRVANNGKQAVEAFQGEPFDLIMMDVLMPEMGGFEATARIREIEALLPEASHHGCTSGEFAQGRGPEHDDERKAKLRVPIIAMTAQDRNGDRERCLEAGMDDYISKPVVAQQLLDLIARLGTAPSDSRAAA